MNAKTLERTSMLATGAFLVIAFADRAMAWLLGAAHGQHAEPAGHAVHEH